MAKRLSHSHTYVRQRVAPDILTRYTTSQRSACGVSPSTFATCALENAMPPNTSYPPAIESLVRFSFAAVVGRRLYGVTTQAGEGCGNEGEGF